jgi:hypothetical protein
VRQWCTYYVQPFMVIIFVKILFLTSVFSNCLIYLVNNNNTNFNQFIRPKRLIKVNGIIYIYIYIYI